MCYLPSRYFMQLNNGSGYYPKLHRSFHKRSPRTCRRTNFLLALGYILPSVTPVWYHLPLAELLPNYALGNKSRIKLLCFQRRASTYRPKQCMWKCRRVSASEWTTCMWSPEHCFSQPGGPQQAEALARISRLGHKLQGSTHGLTNGSSEKIQALLLISSFRDTSMELLNQTR